MQRSSIASVGVVGGGTAGFFAALALKRRFPSLRVAVIESSEVPIIGVGEATTTLMPPFLHHQLGLDPVELYRDVRPTWKLGIKFEWGLPGDAWFTYPFGEADTVECELHEGDLRAQSFGSLLMEADRSPLLRDASSGAIESFLPRLKHAYHLHNAPFVAYLARHARAAGIEHVDARIDQVVTDGARVESLRARDGRELRFDFWIDASGFASLLVGKALGSPFTSFASSLFCDRAIVADVPQRGPIAPYTLAETMDAGWCWKIPVEGVDHRGYVHASAFLGEEQAIAEMRRKNPGMRDPWTVRFRSGRHRDFVRGNTAAIGNAYGFVEPLESTALHMVIVELQYLLACLADDDETERCALPREGAARSASDRVGAHWDYLRWFLAVHYKFNRKLDTELWRAVREDADIGPLHDTIERFRRGPWPGADELDVLVGDPAFGYTGLVVMLLGQKVVAPSVAPRVPREAWAKRLAAQRAAVARALPQAEALAVLRARPDLLEAFAHAPGSWCRSGAEVVSVSQAGSVRMPHDRG